MLPALGMEHLEFNRWATGEVLRCVDALPEAERLLDRKTSYGGIQGTLVHLYQADSVWMDRLKGRPALLLERYAAPEDYSEFRKTWLDVLDDYVELGRSLSEADWERRISYKNLRGEAFESSMRQIVLHLVNHGSYHRGQIITMLRQAGASAVSTDLIHYYRVARGI